MKSKQSQQYDYLCTKQIKKPKNMNEETIIEKRPTHNGRNENKSENNAWKHVTLGGVSGILMGAGLLYAGQAVAATTQEADTNEESADAAPAEDGVSGAQLPVAQLHNDLSFAEAFAAARAEVGPGGVFLWHGGIYNTYTAEEWDAMTAEQKSDFARQVNPEVRAHDIPTPTDDQPDVAAVQQPAVETTAQPVSDTADVQAVAQQIAENFDMGDDVHIVGYADADGHLVVGYDTTGDGQADVAIIDVDDDLRPSDADIIMDREGNTATLGELNDEPDPNIKVYNDMSEDAQAGIDYPVMEI